MVPGPMRRTQPIAALALAALLTLPPTAGAQTPQQLLADATPLADTIAAAPSPRELLADATPLSDVPVQVQVPRDAPPLTQTPLADRDGVELADAGDPRQLLAQAPQATDRPPVTRLPHTGMELVLTLLAGGGMVLTGSGLRLVERGGRRACVPACAGADL